MSLVNARFFCKFLCPAGAMFAIFSLVSPTKVTRIDCMECGKCARSCPMGIDPGRKTVKDTTECIGCTTCVEVCPSKTPISMTIVRKKVQSLLFVVGTVCLFLGAIALFNIIGLMQVTVPSLESVQEGGNYLNSIDLKGSMTIEEGATYVGMSLDEFYSKMNIPVSVPGSTRLNAVKDYVSGYDFHAMKAK